MLWFAVFALAISMWSLIYWGSMKLLDRHNPKNTFGKAILVALLYTLTAMFPIPGLLIVGIWLLLLTRLTMWQYDFDLIPALITTAATVLVPYFASPYLLRFVGDSELRGELLLYGIPGVTFAVYIASRIKNRNAEPEVRWADKNGALPEARVVADSKPVTPPVTAPQIIKPPRYDASTPVGDKPSLLT